MNKHNWTGLPFKWGGSDFSGADCVGLIWLYLREELGIVLPPDGGRRRARDWVANSQARMIVYLDRHCDRVNPPLQQGDIVVIHDLRQAAHVGVMVDVRRMLHTSCDRDSEIGWLDAYPTHRIVGCWRPWAKED